MEKSHFTLQTLNLKLSFNVQYLAGDIVRSCFDLRSFLPDFQPGTLKGQQDRQDCIGWNKIILNICKDRTWCNGSGILAEICTMMILLPTALVIIIYFFSRL
jgi:hypothetical protein